MTGSSSTNDRAGAPAHWLARTAEWMWLLTSAAFASLALAILALSFPEEWPKTAATPPRARVTPSVFEPQQLDRPSAAAAPEPPPLAASAAPSEAPLTPLSPRQLLIDLGPPRSEVFVDGRRVGHTPFLGQVKCRPGKEISIQVIPERGFPLEEKRVCPE